MVKMSILLDEYQMERIEQIVMDRDGLEAIKFLDDLIKKIKSTKIGCNPLEFKAREGIEGTIRKYKNNV
jgi:hypothetical protein